MKAIWSLLSVCVVVVASCATESAPSEAAEGKVDFTRVTETLEAVDVPGIEKIHTVAGVYLAGQPDEAGFEAAKEGGVRTVINLRHDDEIELEEKELVEGLGMTYLHLPWNGAEELTDEIFDRTRELLSTAEKPVLFHCKSANRVGATWLPYRVLDGGLTLEAAVAEAKSVGMKTAAYEEKAKDYIERNKD